MVKKTSKTYNEGTGGHDLSGLTERDVDIGDILPEARADDLDADSLTLAKIDQSEIRLPICGAKSRQDFHWSLAGVLAVLLDSGVDLPLHLLIPVALGCKVAKDKTSVDASIELTGKERAQNELRTARSAKIHSSVSITLLDLH